GEVDGLTGREGAFLACSFWLADCYAMLGRDDDARELLERLLALRNDVGLLSEEYDAVAGRLVGNFPQAFSHVSLVNTVSKLAGEEKPHMGSDVAERTRRGMHRSATGAGKLHRAGRALTGRHHRGRAGDEQGDPAAGGAA
ncbi:MAG: glycoside hydrolase family 15 protein, partial [Acidimicrobiales bacterium]